MISAGCWSRGLGYCLCLDDILHPACLSGRAGGCGCGGGEGGGAPHVGFHLEDQGLVLLKAHGNNWSCVSVVFTASSVTHGG